jgi:hypothetical protein
MMFWLIALAVAVVLFSLAWWSSGRTRRRVPPGLGAAEETNVGWAVNQAIINRDAGSTGAL